MVSRQPPLDTPPVVPWDQWYARAAGLRQQGQHILFIGPTQSGKTQLCRAEARLRQFVVVLGTKPKDPSLDDYINEGYLRIETWPPTPRDWRRGRAIWEEGEARFVLWPKIVSREQLRAFAPMFRRALEEIYIEGRWTIVADEGLWLCSRQGLNLGDVIGDIAYGSASNKVSLYLLIQRNAGVPPITWTSVSYAEIFHMGRTDDVRELASLGIYLPKATIAAVQGLKGHQFLDLPCRAGAEWSISEMTPEAIG